MTASDHEYAAALCSQSACWQKIGDEQGHCYGAVSLFQRPYVSLAVLDGEYGRCECSSVLIRQRDPTRQPSIRPQPLRLQGCW